MHPNLAKALVCWARWSNGEKVQADEARILLGSALRDDLPYDQEVSARVLLISFEAKEHFGGEVERGKVPQALQRAFDDFQSLVASDSSRNYEYFNSPAKTPDRIPVRVILEQLDLIRGFIGEKRTETAGAGAAIEYLEQQIRPLMAFTSPPALSMLTAQAKAYLQQAIEESEDDPAGTPSAKRAIACAQEAIRVAEFYSEDRQKELAVSWATEFLGGLDEIDTLQQTAKTSVDQSSSSKCFIASAAFHDSHPVVTVLREWRDDRLRQAIGGRILIRAYELISPPFAKIVHRNGALRTLTRRSLTTLAARLTR